MKREDVAFAFAFYTRARAWEGGVYGVDQNILGHGHGHGGSCIFVTQLNQKDIITTLSSATWLCLGTGLACKKVQQTFMFMNTYSGGRSRVRPELDCDCVPSTKLSATRDPSPSHIYVETVILTPSYHSTPDTQYPSVVPRHIRHTQPHEFQIDAHS